GVATATGDIDLTTDVGRMVARILAAVARAEVERKAARQKLANEQARAQGFRWKGGPRPFGYDDDGKIIPAEAEAIRWGAQQIIEGATIQSVADAWSDRGLFSVRHK